MAVPPRVHETGRRVDQEPQPPEAGLALEAADEVVREPDPLDRRAEDELARMQHEDVVLGDRDQLGELLLVLLDVDCPQVVIAEDAEVTVDVQVDRGRLDAALPERVDADPAASELFTDRLVGEDHGLEQVSRPWGRNPRDNLIIIVVGLGMWLPTG